MIGIRARIAMSALALALGALPACGEEDPAAGDDDDDGGSESDSYTGKVVNSIMLNETIPNIEVRQFDSETGEFLTGADSTQKSNASGMVTFPSRAENTGLFAVGGGAWSDTWNFPPAKAGEEEFIRMSGSGSANAVPGIAGYMNDPDASAVAGSILWHNPDTEEDEYVGCVTIEEGDGVKDIRYFNGQLPTNPMGRALNLGTKPPMGDPAFPSNDGEAGRWFIANLSGGKHTIRAKIGDEVVGERDLVITPRKEGNTLMFPDGTTTESNVHLASIWIDESFEKNPTPADCK